MKNLRYKLINLNKSNNDYPLSQRISWNVLYVWKEINDIVFKELITIVPCQSLELALWPYYDICILGGTLVRDVFEIDPVTGRISLRQSPPSDRDQIFLNVTAKDDGSCCSTPTGSKILSSTALITINIEDEENEKPRFENCNYRPTVLEEQDPGVLVLRVSPHSIHDNYMNWLSETNQIALLISTFSEQSLVEK